MKMRRIAAALAAALLVTAGFATGAAAGPPTSSRPVVGVEVTAQDGADVTIGYTVNRGANQVAVVTYSLNGGDAVSAPAPTAVTKKSSGEGFDVTAANGANTLTVTVTLTNGETATSPAVEFSYEANPYARAGCFGGIVATYFLTDGTSPQLLNTSGEPLYDATCTRTQYLLAATALVWASDVDAARLACRQIAGGELLEPIQTSTDHLFLCAL